MDGLIAPKEILNVGNSGTSIRLLMGILAGQSFASQLTGDASIVQRPMRRVMEPLRKMGANIRAARDDNYAPISIIGSKLRGIDHTLAVPSAQVKTSVLFAGLFANGETIIREPVPTRDHTERLFQWLELPVDRSTHHVAVRRLNAIPGKDIEIARDISSSAFLITLGLLVSEGHVMLPGVGINPGRTGILDVFQQMGASISLKNCREISGEPVADIEATPSRMSGVKIGGELIPRLIDEIPILCVLASMAAGTTEIRDAGELRVKESDRIKTIILMLQSFGVEVEELKDGMIIHGGKKLRGATINSYGDHRIAMAATIAGLCANGESAIENVECVETSFPNFSQAVRNLGGEIRE
jgi:3-phosphoshikimate 1-carboxyvinyltransferase